MKASYQGVRKAVLTRAVHLLERELRPHAGYGSSSYAQCGEDLIVRYLFQLCGIPQPSYVDIGAHHPYYLSNTALFYISGSRGVNIEPNPLLITEFNRQRPADVNLNIGVASLEGQLEFHCFEDATLSTFSEAEAETLIRAGHKETACIPVPVLPLEKIVEQYCAGRFPDFLTIDVEGFETEILSTIDYARNYPKIICVETANYSPTGRGGKRQELMEFVEEQGYVLYADTNLNSIYIKEELWGTANNEPGQ